MNRQSIVLPMLNALLGCVTWQDLLNTGMLHVNGFFHYLLYTKHSFKTAAHAKWLRKGLTSSHGMDLSHFINVGLAVIAELEDEEVENFGKVRKMYASAQPYPLVVMCARNFRKDKEAAADGFIKFTSLDV